MRPCASCKGSCKGLFKGPPVPPQSHSVRAGAPAQQDLSQFRKAFQASVWAESSGVEQSRESPVMFTSQQVGDWAAAADSKSLAFESRVPCVYSAAGKRSILVQTPAAPQSSRAYRGTRAFARYWAFQPPECRLQPPQASAERHYSRGLSPAPGRKLEGTSQSQSCGKARTVTPHEKTMTEVLEVCSKLNTSGYPNSHTKEGWQRTAVQRAPESHESDHGIIRQHSNKNYL